VVDRRKRGNLLLGISKKIEMTKMLQFFNMWSGNLIRSFIILFCLKVTVRDKIYWYPSQ